MDKQDEILAILTRIAWALEKLEGRRESELRYHQINGKWCLGSGKISWSPDIPASRGGGEGRH